MAGAGFAKIIANLQATLTLVCRLLHIAAHPPEWEWQDCLDPTCRTAREALSDVAMRRAVRYALVLEQLKEAVMAQVGEHEFLGLTDPIQDAVKMLLIIEGTT